MITEVERFRILRLLQLLGPIFTPYVLPVILKVLSKCSIVENFTKLNFSFT